MFGRTAIYLTPKSFSNLLFSCVNLKISMILFKNRLFKNKTVSLKLTVNI